MVTLLKNSVFNKEMGLELQISRVTVNISPHYDMPEAKQVPNCCFVM